MENTNRRHDWLFGLHRSHVSPAGSPWVVPPAARRRVTGEPPPTPAPAPPPTPTLARRAPPPTPTPTPAAGGGGSGNGKPPSFDEIYKAHADWVFRTLGRLGVRENQIEDLAQDVFRAVYTSLHKFDPTKPVEPWLYSFCRKFAYRHRRSAYFRRVFTVDICSLWERSSEEMSPEQNVSTRQEQKELDDLLDKLDLDKRAVFVMYEIEEMGCEEIAKKVGIPLGTVHSRLKAAREKLQKAYLCRKAKRLRKDDP